MYSYSAGIIAEFLHDNGIRFEPHSSRACMVILHDHGLRAEFPCKDGSLYMSIQTCPPVAGDAFAETALQNDRANINFRELGYFDSCRRHYTPEELFEHIKLVRDTLASKVSNKGHEPEPDITSQGAS